MTGSKHEDLKRTNFGVMLSTLVDAIGTDPLFQYEFRGDLAKMKKILRVQSDPSDSSKCLIPAEVYDKLNNVEEFIYSLCPRYINYRNTSLLHSLMLYTYPRHLHYVVDYENDPTGNVSTSS